MPQARPVQTPAMSRKYNNVRMIMGYVCIAINIAGMDWTRLKLIKTSFSHAKVGLEIE